MKIPDTTRAWIEYFETNASNLLPVPWHLGERLSENEFETIAASVRVFQLGENSEGKSLITLTRSFAMQEEDAELVQAMTKFIEEEQRHARWLAKFIDQVKIPLATAHWSDRIFRHLRHLWNLEVSLAVLLTAELVARVYYHALYRATTSSTLRPICRQLLRDEVFHVYFHTHLLRKIRIKRLPVLNSIWNILYRLFHAGTLLIVWAGHSAVLRRGGFSFKQYWKASGRYCEHALSLLRPGVTDAVHPITRRSICGIRPS